MVPTKWFRNPAGSPFLTRCLSKIRLRATLPSHPTDLSHRAGAGLLTEHFLTVVALVLSASKPASRLVIDVPCAGSPELGIA